MKVLLVYPWFPNTFWSIREALSLYGKSSAFPPLGLMTVAALLPSEWELRLVDLNVRPLKHDEIDWCDMVFLSAMHIQKDSLQEVAHLAKSKGKCVIVGGPFTSCVQVHNADHIFIGEAETTVPEFLCDLETGTAKKVYEATDRPPLSLTPTPRFDLIDFKHYNSMSVQYSRGCPFNCEFCDIIEIYGRSPRTKSNQQMLKELDALYEARWRGDVFIVDDNFIGNKKNVKRFLPELAAWSKEHEYPFLFMTEASVNLADDDELLRQMRECGFLRVFVGIETPVEESLKAAQKGQNTRRNLVSCVHKIQDYGIEVMGGFIVGFDDDPADIFERQIDFIRESAIPLSLVSLLAAIPNTQLWRRLEREGRLINFDHSGNNTDGCSLNFVPRMDKDSLIEGYKSILRTIYNPSEYYQRSLDCLSRVNRDGAPKVSGRLSVNDVLGIFRITLTLGMRDQDRSSFWRFIKQLLQEHRQKVPQGLALAALGYHFRKLTEQYCGNV